MTTYNFVTNFGAAVAPADSSPALATWLATAADGDTLIIPAGTYHWASTNGPTNGLKNATISATGASVDALFIGNAGLIQQNYMTTARIQTVVSGATSVTIISSGGTVLPPADSSIFAIGQWIMISGLGLQIPDSYPPNLQYFEFRKITGISGAVISFADPLRFSYKSTWPLIDAFATTINIGTSTLTSLGHLFEGQTAIITTSGALPTGLTAGTGYYIKNLSGTNFQLSATQFGAPITLSGTQSGTHYYHAQNYDLAGPATIYGMLDVFDGTQVYTGLEVTSVGSGISCSGGKSLLLNGMAFTGNNGPSPSMGKSIIIRQCQIGEQNEVDKCLEYLEYDRCTATGIKQIQVQSNTPTDLLIEGMALTTLNGTAYNTTLDAATSVDTLIGGATGFGRSNSLNISSGTIIGPANPTTGTRVSGHYILLSEVSFSGGIFSVLNSDATALGDAVRLFVPGFKYTIGYSTANQISNVDNNGRTTVFRVLDITQDATNVYIMTDLAALPTGTFSGQPANVIFAYGVKTLIPPSSFLAGITAFVEPPDATNTSTHIRKPKLVSHSQSTDWKFVR